MPVDYYQLLGVSRNADSVEIKKAYRKLAHQFHPDQNQGDKEAEEKFKEIANAYEILSDPTKRTQYDRFGKAAVENGGLDDFENFDFFNVLGSVFGKKNTKGRDFHIDLKVSLEDIVHGTEQDVIVPTIEKCETCSGKGAKPGTEILKCKRCKGSGQAKGKAVFISLNRKCSECSGRGRIIKSKCSDCKGIGYVQGSETRSIQVPPGAKEGLKLKWSGEGAPSYSNGAPGDLLVTIRLQAHPLFDRVKNNVRCTVPISFTQAALGAKVDVPTLDGKVIMTIPPGTQSEKILRLRKKGFPKSTGSRGDQLVKLVVETPINLSEKQRDLLEEFARLSGEDVQPERKGFFDRMKSVLG